MYPFLMKTSDEEKYTGCMLFESSSQTREDMSKLYGYDDNV
jgi:hypothetical protein